MKIFVIGNDKSIFDKNSRLFGRVVEYSQLVDKYKVIVPNNTKTRLDISEHLSIISFGGENKLLQIIKLFFGSIYILKKEKFDVISVQDQYYLAFVAYLLSKKFKIGLEIQIHGFEKYNGLRKFIADFIIPRANSIRVVSNRLKKELIDKYKINENKITVVPIYSKLKDVEILDKNNNEEFIFLTISRLVEVKNIEMQIRALKNVIDFFENNNEKKVKNLKLWITGSGELDEKLKNLTNELGLQKNIEFFGWQNDLDNFYKKADVFLLTSNYEGWGMVIIEASNYKLPIIMTDVGCANEFIINNENGIVIPVKDQNALQNSMIELIDNEELRLKLSQNAKNSVEKLLSKEKTFDLYKESWKKAIL